MISKLKLNCVAPLNAIDPADFLGHVISEISNISCDYVDLVEILTFPQSEDFRLHEAW